MVEAFSVADEDQASNESAQPPASSSSGLLSALALAVLVAVVIGGCFVYLRSSGTMARLTSSRSARIAFMGDTSGDWEIYMMDPDGSNLVNLTNNPGADGLPIHTTGQSRLIFTSDRNGLGLDLFMMDLDGGNVSDIALTLSGSEFPIAWSPDGEFLVFASDQSGTMELFLAPTAGGELINLSQREAVQTFDDWLPGTDQFILTSGSAVGMPSISITNVADDIHQPITDGNFPAGGGRWSPDGQKVAFMAMALESNSVNVYVADATGGEPVNLTQSSFNNGFPRWSPDGSKIAFSSDRDGNTEIYVMNPDGSNQTNLTNNPANDSVQGDFAWSPDGTQILFLSDRDGNMDVFVMDADGSNQVNLTQSPGNDINAIWVK